MKSETCRPEPPHRSGFSHFVQISTRWMDNDVYGHLNNVVYYSFFDTAVNQFLIEQGALDILTGTSIGLVVHSECDYFAPLAFPGSVEAGLRIAMVGASSVRYEVALFGVGVDRAAACGRFVHVYVDRESRRPQPLPPLLQRALAILSPASASTKPW
jgi:acyl-CoA thioester hydrolase